MKYQFYAIVCDVAGNQVSSKSSASPLSITTSIQYVTSLSINPNTAQTKYIGDTFTITPTVTPTNANNRNVNWTSSNTSVATVSPASTATGTATTVTCKAAGTTTITATAADGSEKTATCSVTVLTPTYNATFKGYSGAASTTTSYVGYYADINYDGTVDGVIYADLRFAVSGIWLNNSDSNFSYNKLTNTNTYYISTYKFNGEFGEKNVIIPNTTTNNDRFYIMALKDINSEFTNFYYAAYNNTNLGLLGVSSSENDFGQGRTNTRNLITKWKNKLYGAQNAGTIYKDIWNLSEVQACLNNNWFIASRAEWCAFAYNLGISTTNRKKFGLNYNYWTSSVVNSTHAWAITINKNSCWMNEVNSTSDGVRLSATF